jgi:uncharacterized protein YigA (DUF484 family)
MTPDQEKKLDELISVSHRTVQTVSLILHEVRRLRERISVIESDRDKLAEIEAKLAELETTTIEERTGE